MARDIGQRLDALKARRSGMNKIEKLAADQAVAAYADSVSTDLYESRSGSTEFTRYALGAMQEVKPEYTDVSLKTAERVGNQLQKGLSAAGVSAEFRLQGSVPANVHIQGYSDVDLLVLAQDFFTYATYGVLARGGHYKSPSSKTTEGVLLDLRQKSTAILTNEFPKAEVDTSGGKAVKISKGSLARSVDVVPSHWNDTIEYQSTNLLADRGVTIYDRKAKQPVDNLPFKHIQLLGDRDNQTYSGLKKIIRLCKNVRSDAEGNIDLPSFDLAALMYHADFSALQLGGVYDLAIVAEAQRFIDFLYRSPDHANALRTPDGTRVILNTQSKRDAVTSLSIELDQLARDVGREQSQELRKSALPILENVRKVLNETYIQ